jgi:hypothetical protein
MADHTIQANRVAADAHRAGEALWSAIEAADIPRAKRFRAFEAALDAICDERADDYCENALWAAAATAAVPAVDLDGPTRAIINRNAANAWDAYVRFLEAEALAEEADYRADLARDERLMGAA